MLLFRFITLHQMYIMCYETAIFIVANKICYSAISCRLEAGIIKYFNTGNVLRSNLLTSGTTHTCASAHPPTHPPPTHIHTHRIVHVLLFCDNYVHSWSAVFNLVSTSFRWFWRFRRTYRKKKHGQCTQCECWTTCHSVSTDPHVHTWHFFLEEQSLVSQSW